jgi:hypothetical protein
MEGFGSGAGAAAGADAGAAAGADAPPAGACAGACCCPRAGRLRTTITMNVRRPPHCFFKVILLSNFYSQSRSIVASVENLRGGLRKDQRKFWIGAIKTLSLRHQTLQSEIFDGPDSKMCCYGHLRGHRPRSRRDTIRSHHEMAPSTAVVGNGANKPGWRVCSERAVRT